MAGLKLETVMEVSQCSSDQGTGELRVESQGDVALN